MNHTEQFLDDSLRPWLVRATALVGRRLRDARAHAAEGRMEDAGDRLDELAAGLGQDLSDARAGFYRASHGLHRTELDPDLLDHTVVPTAEGATVARSVPIGGRDQARHLKALVEHAEGELRLGTSIQQLDAATKAAYLRSWEDQHGRAIAAAARGALSDAQMTLHTAVGQLMIRPEIR